MLLVSSLEHGTRAIQPLVVQGVDTQADQAFWKIYTSLFKAALPLHTAQRHISLFAFLSALRNTIHNNGVYYPLNHCDTEFTIGGTVYRLVNGQRVELFAWEHLILWLPLIREAMTDLLNSVAVVTYDHISDVASFPIPGVEHHYA